MKKLVVDLDNVICINNMISKLNEFLNSQEIITEKTTKKKGLKTFDVKPKIKKFAITKTQNGTGLYFLLPAGNEENINPTIILDAAEKSGIEFEIVNIIRGGIFDKNLNLFK